MGKRDGEKSKYDLFGKCLSYKHVDSPKYMQSNYFSLKAHVDHFNEKEGLEHPDIFLTFTLDESLDDFIEIKNLVKR
jgi:hypothetical protein